VQLGELRPGDLLATAFHEPALVAQIDRQATDGGLVRLHLTTMGGERSWATAWMSETAELRGTVHRL
jgi:hypothetical protein